MSCCNSTIKPIGLYVQFYNTLDELLKNDIPPELEPFLNWDYFKKTALSSGWVEGSIIKLSEVEPYLRVILKEE